MRCFLHKLSPSVRSSVGISLQCQQLRHPLCFSDLLLRRAQLNCDVNPQIRFSSPLQTHEVNAMHRHSQTFRPKFYNFSFYLYWHLKNTQTHTLSLLHNTGGEILEGNLRGQSGWLSDGEEPQKEWMRVQKEYGEMEDKRGRGGGERRERGLFSSVLMARKDESASLSFPKQCDAGFPSRLLPCGAGVV